MKNVKSYGFSLAEVLITLGIIGVVAAVTIPSLVTSTSSSEMKTGFRKAVSVLSQAVTMNLALDGIDFSSMDANYGKTMLNTRISTTGSAVSVSPAMGPGNTNCVQAVDGMIFCVGAMSSCGTQKNADCVLHVDINGPKGPNSYNAANPDRHVLYAVGQSVIPYDGSMGNTYLYQ